MRIDDTATIQQLGLTPQAGSAVPESAEAFSEALNEAMAQAQAQKNAAAPAAALPNPTVVRTVKNGDTLSHIVRQEAQSRGLQLTGAQEFRSVMALAQANGIANPNRIFVGQQIQLSPLLARWSSPGDELLAQKSPGAQATTATQTTSNTSTPPSTQAVLSTKGTPTEAHPVLRQTLDRAVSRGFIPANEKQDVYNKILQVAAKHKFAPDDFARLTLMESDGMNPQATNQRCHGIIQFCDGPARGAASVGFGHAPRSIQSLSVYQQLHLVDTYFDKVGLNKQGQVPLDELYLAVLQPSARVETRPEVPLGIPGNQAHYLYEGRNPQSSITRNSIMQGLIQNTLDRLGTLGQNISNALPNRLQAQRSAQYRAVENPDSLQR